MFKLKAKKNFDIDEKLRFKKICVITGSRADYGILSNFLKGLIENLNYI